MEQFENRLSKMMESLFNSGIITSNLHAQFNSDVQLINFLDKVINSTIEGIIVFDENKKCVKANLPASRIFGYSIDEMIGMSAFQFISEESLEIIKQSMKHEEQEPYEAVMVKKNSEKFPALVRGKNILINSKKIRISAVIDLSELKAKEEEIYKIAYFDRLTNLPNRQKMIKDMNSKDVFACVIFNIDKFGHINDLFGSETGDRLLLKFAQELEKEKSGVYRIGGDEFAILFDRPVTYKQVEKYIKKIIAKMEKMEFYANEEPFHIHVRAGGAIYGNKLLTHADLALREAKRKKIPFLIYSESQQIEQRYKQNLEMSVIIHKALQNNRVECHYQPVFDAEGNIRKYEALVRIRDEKGKLYYPNEFLPVAKTTKLYSRITKEVIKQACETFAGSTKEFNVNISIEDILSEELIEEITDIVVSTGTGKQIGFEILETEGIDNYDTVKVFIDRVKKLGSSIAIDDFGSGYSNFKHILSLNINCLKIDGSLIKEIYKNQKNIVIVETIVEFAKKIGVETVAEFVCSEEVYEITKKLGIDCFQGFYLSKPLKPEELNKGGK